MSHFAFIILAVGSIGLPQLRAAEPAPLQFQLTFDPAALNEPFTGRVFVMLNRASPGDLSRSISWGRPEPVFAKDVKNWKPGEPLVIDAGAIAFPTPLKDVPAGEYFVSAVMDRDQGGISFSASAGNIYAKAAKRALDPAKSGPVALKLDQVYQERAFPESATVKLVDIPSERLSKFHGREVRQRAGVVLPPSYAKEPNRRYPTVYVIPGFGGNHFGAARSGQFWSPDGVEAIVVELDPLCRLGHHVFADSANNGPVGEALIKEMIPHIEATYRAHSAPGARFVTGGSSGGWSSLWLQVAYPDFFGGCWSLAPDPVDFRDFQRIDLTKPGQNLFTEPSGQQRALSRAGGRGQPMYFKGFSDMESIMGHGGQLESFEAVFSPRGDDVKPRKLWDRTTGAIDPEVARAWQPYDIRLKLEREWPTIGPKLAGKLHIYTGDIDTFYLDGAARLLQRSLRDLGSDAKCEMFPDRDHGTIVLAVRDRVRKEMAEAWRKWEKSNPSRAD